MDLRRWRYEFNKPRQGEMTMGFACQQCEHFKTPSQDDPCASCLERVRPGEPLVFQNFTLAKEEGEDGDEKSNL